jgi:hypothetical protein
VVLKIGVDSIHAHKVVLASVSPYFYAMFNGECISTLFIRCLVESLSAEGRTPALNQAPALFPVVQDASLQTTPNSMVRGLPGSYSTDQEILCFYGTQRFITVFT